MSEQQLDRPQVHRIVHPPILALFFIIVAFLLGGFAHIFPAPATLLRNIGLILTFIGLLFGTSAVIELKKAGTTLDPHGSVSQLVSSGIYRISRNPIYLGYLMMVIGFPLYSGNYWGILTAPLFAGTMNRLVIEKEEAHLEGRFQKQYAVYRSRVRRWL